MRLPNFLPDDDLLKQYEGIRSGLRQRRRAGNIALILAVLQAVILTLNGDWWQGLWQGLSHVDLSSPIQSLKAFLASPKLWLPPLLLTGLIFSLFFFYRWRFWLKESREPFRYTCSIAEFQPVKGTPKSEFMTWLSHDLAENLNKRIKRLSFLDEKHVKAVADTEETPEADSKSMREKDKSHVHIGGYYLVRRTPDGKRNIEIMPRVRIGPPRSPETLAHPVQFPINGEKSAGRTEDSRSFSDDTEPKKEEAPTARENSLNAGNELARTKYDQLLERVYFSIATEIYLQIKRDVQQKIELLPTNYFRAVALLHEAEDYSGSNTLDAYDEALSLFERTRELFDPEERRLSPYRLRRWCQHVVRWIIKAWRGGKRWLAYIWPRLGQVEVMCARAEIGYANALIDRRILAGMSGRMLNPVFQAKTVAEKALARLEKGSKDVPRFHETLYHAYVTLALAWQQLGSRLEGAKFLKKAEALDQKLKGLDPDLIDKKTRFLFVSSQLEQQTRASLNLLRQAVERKPRYHVAQSMLAYEFEGLWRTRQSFERNVAELVFKEYDAALKITPGNISAWANLGYMHWLLGNMAEAETSYKAGREYKEISRETFVAELDYGLARIFAEQGNFTEAYEHYLSAVTANLSQGSAHGFEGYSGYFFLHMNDELRNRFVRYKENVEEHIRFWQGEDGQGRTVEQAFEELEHPDKKERAVGCLAGVLVQFLKKVTQREHEVFTNVLRQKGLKWPVEYMPWTGNIERAKEILRCPETQKILQLPECLQLINKYQPIARIRDSIYSFMLTDYAEACDIYGSRFSDYRWGNNARRAYKQAAKINPDYVMPRYKFGVLMEEEALYAASRWFESVVRLEPRWPEGMLKLEEVKARVAQKEAQEQAGKRSAADAAIYNKVKEGAEAGADQLRKLLPHAWAEILLSDLSGKNVESVLSNEEIKWEKDLDDLHVQALITWTRVLSLQEDIGALTACEKLLDHIQRWYRPASLELWLLRRDIAIVASTNNEIGNSKSQDKQISSEVIDRCNKSIRTIITEGIKSDPPAWLPALGDEAFENKEKIMEVGAPTRPGWRWAYPSVLEILSERKWKDPRIVRMLPRYIELAPLAREVLREMLSEDTCLGSLWTKSLWKDWLDYLPPEDWPTLESWVRRRANERKEDGNALRHFFEALVLLLQRRFQDSPGSQEPSQRVVVGPVEGNFRPNLVVTHEATKADTVEEYAADQLPYLERRLPGFELGKEGAAQFGTKLGFLREFTWAYEGEEINQLQFYWFAGDIAYTATYSHRADKANKLEAHRRFAAELIAQVDRDRPAPLALISSSEPHAVPPITIEADEKLFQWAEETTKDRPAFTKYLSDMRTRVRANTGIEVPDVRISVVRTKEAGLPEDGYQFLFNGLPVRKGVLDTKRWFCPDPKSCQEILGGNLSPVFNPATGEHDGVWLDQDQSEKIRRKKGTFWDPLEYVVRDLEAVLRENLARFIGVQEVHKMVNDWQAGVNERRALVDQALPDVSARLRLVQVLKALTKEFVPIKNLEGILRILKEQSGRVKEREPISIGEAIRLELKGDLPGNNESYRFIHLADSFEEEVQRGIWRKNGKIFFAIPKEANETLRSTIRNRVKGKGQRVGLVTRMEGIRPFVRRLIECEFPHLAVLSSDELLPHLQNRVHPPDGQ